MKLKDKIKSYSFWVSLASAVILILKVLGSRFGFTIDESMVSDLFTSLCSILVLLGIIIVPNTSTQQNLKDSQDCLLDNNLDTQTNSFQLNNDLENNDDLKNNQEDELVVLNNDSAQSSIDLNINSSNLDENNIYSSENVSYSANLVDTYLNTTDNESDNAKIDTEENISIQGNSIIINSETVAIGSKTPDTNESESLVNSNVDSSQEVGKNTRDTSDENITLEQQDFQTLLKITRENYSGDLSKYIEFLQNQIKNTQDNM